MFTGLVEALGTVADVQQMPHGRRLSLREPLIASELSLGESVAINGVCLTVVNVTGDSWTMEAGPETLAKTNLAGLQPGDRVNLERALRLGDRLGGHWVQGHVDGVGTVAAREEQADWEMIWFRCAPELTRQMVVKGSIAVDGVSLTLVDVQSDIFQVMLIPHTLSHTTLGLRQPGDPVNLETDVLAKYVAKLVEGQLATSTRQP